MTDISDELLVTIPTQEDGDVEAHGMREVAVGLGVAAAVLGSAGVADASEERGPLGGAAGAVTTTIHDNLTGPGSTHTMKATSRLLKPQSKQLNETADQADARTRTTVQLGGRTAGEVQRRVDETLAEVDRRKGEAEDDADEAATGVRAELDERLTAAGELLASTERALRTQAGIVHDGLITIKIGLEKDAAELERAIGEDVKEVERMAQGLLSTISGIVTDTANDVRDLFEVTTGQLGMMLDGLRSDADRIQKDAERQVHEGVQTIGSEVGRQKAAAEKLAEQTRVFAEDTARSTHKEAERQAAAAIELGLDTKAALESRAAAEVAGAKATVNTQVQQGMTALQATATGAEALKDSTVSAGAGAARDAGAKVQQEADTTVTAVTGAPEVATDAVVEAVERVETAWKDTTDSIEVPQLGEAVTAVTQDAETAVESLPDAGKTVGAIQPPSV